jgi:hypothetical protein
MARKAGGLLSIYLMTTTKRNQKREIFSCNISPAHKFQDSIWCTPKYFILPQESGLIKITPICFVTFLFKRRFPVLKIWTEEVTIKISCLIQKLTEETINSPPKYFLQISKPHLP